mmetsp:Transcript_11049/g.34055  ORF Transcript_11049/g.34055 Transcript_11049/m.34055 type:complete len:227 (-) Transcript_11049:239-919(-)
MLDVVLVEVHDELVGQKDGEEQDDIHVREAARQPVEDGRDLLLREPLHALVVQEQHLVDAVGAPVHVCNVFFGRDLLGLDSLDLRPDTEVRAHDALARDGLVVGGRLVEVGPAFERHDDRRAEPAAVRLERVDLLLGVVGTRGREDHDNLPQERRRFDHAALGAFPAVERPGEHERQQERERRAHNPQDGAYRELRPAGRFSSRRVVRVVAPEGDEADRHPDCRRE